MNKRTLALPAIGMLLASMALVGCNKTEEARVENPPADARVEGADQSVGTRVEQKAEAVKEDVQKGMDQAAAGARETAGEVKEAGQDAAQAVGSKVEDVTITTSVNAELAKDPNLSALKINVDTKDGRVTLRGSAPTSTARERATALASSVQGVKGVENQLTVEPAK
jgi:hyperosmotically inducible protein